MRDTSVSDEDLAIASAKEKLASLPGRPGYREAMLKEPTDTVTRIGALVAAAVCGGIIYACTIYVRAAWLMWFFIIVFGLIGLFCLFGMIGMSPKLAADSWGVAILEKRIADDQHKIAFLRENGERHELDVSESMYDLLRPGDLGVLKVCGSSPDFDVDSFKRL